MFEVIHGHAEQGQRIEAYDGSILAKEALFLGQKGTWGLIYVPAEMFDGVEVPFEALAAVLIKGDEIEVMSKSSAFRVASLLGAKYTYYPCPPWSDPSRKPVVLAKEFAKSILSQVDHVRTPGLTVRQTFPQDKKSVIALRIEGTALIELNSLLAGLPDKGAIALLTDPDPEATMRFSWMPAVGKTGVIFANTGPWVTGCFVLLVFGEGMEDRGNEIEDGIGLILSPASWNKLKASIASVQPMAIPLGKEGRTLKTEFIHTVAVDPLAPNPFVPSIFTLFQSQEEFISRLVDVSSLKEYVQLFERTASSALADVPQGDACGFLIAVGIKPGKKTMVWCEAVEGSLPEETLKKLETVLGNIPPIEVKDGPVAFMLEGVLWGRTVNTFPKFPSAWSKALVASGRPFSSLDELFKIIWPD